MTRPIARGTTGLGRIADGIIDLLIGRLCLAGAVLCLTAAVISVAAQVVFRYGLGNSLIWAEELARYALIWSSFLGASVGYRAGQHVAVTVLVEHLPAPAPAVLSRLVHFIALGFALIVAWQGWFLTMRVFARGEIANALQVSIGWAYLAVPVGALFLAIAAAAALVGRPTAPTPMLTTA